MSIKKAELFNGNKNVLSHRPWSAKQTKSIYVCHFFSLMLCLFRPNVIVEGGVDILCGRGIASFGVWQHGSFRYTGRSLLFQYSRQKSHYRVTSRIPFAQLFNNARLTKRQPLPKNQQPAHRHPQTVGQDHGRPSRRCKPPFRQSSLTRTHRSRRSRSCSGCKADPSQSGFFHGGPA